MQPVSFLIPAGVVLAGLLPLAPRIGAELKTVPPTEFVLTSIGTVQKEKDRTTLVLRKNLEPGLLGLGQFSHVWVLWWFDRNDTPQKRSILQVHPRGKSENPLTGVFACRAPVRPNLIGMTLCRVVSVKANVVEVEQIDALAGTPILDLKPYIPGIDQAAASVPDWLRDPGRSSNVAAEGP